MAEEFELWSWMAKDPTGWSQIGAMIPTAPELGMVNLTFRSLDQAMRVEDIARLHGKAMHQEVQLVHFMGTPFKVVVV